MTMHRGQLATRTSHRNSRTSSRNHLTYHYRDYSHHHTINRRRPITRKKHGPNRRTTSTIKRAGNRRLTRRLQLFRNQTRIGNRRHTILSSMTRVTNDHRGITRRANNDHATSARIRRRGGRQIGGTISRHTRGVASRTLFCYALYARRRHRTIKRSGGQHARYRSLGVPLHMKRSLYVKARRSRGQRSTRRRASTSRGTRGGTNPRTRQKTSLTLLSLAHTGTTYGSNATTYTGRHYRHHGSQGRQSRGKSHHRLYDVTRATRGGRVHRIMRRRSGSGSSKKRYRKGGKLPSETNARGYFIFRSLLPGVGHARTRQGPQS